MKKRFLLVFLLVTLLAVGRSSLAEGYEIGEEDMLQISVWGNSELSVHVPVRPDGMISFPLVGDVKAAGMTTHELKVSLEKELMRYVKTPVVSVIVTAVNSFKVYVFGGAGARAQAGGGQLDGGNAATGASTSGEVVLRKNTTLLQFLALIGSPGDIDLNNAYLLRNGKKLAVNFKQLVTRGDASQDIYLERNDVIYLPGGITNPIRVIGAVRAPSVLPFREGMTALDAVLSAGGFTEFASQNDVHVVRKEGDVTQNLKVRLKDVMNGNISRNLPLKPGDIVTVDTTIF